MPIIYKATNVVTDHCYIGVTKGTLKKRRYEHEHCAKVGRYLYMPFIRALRKYGIDWFRWEVLETHESYKDALDGEIWWIATLLPEYNVTRGGQGIVGVKWTQARRELMSGLLKGRVMSAEARAKMSVAKKGKPNLKLRGRKASAEHIEKNRQLGLQNIERWRKYAQMGPATLSKAVRCLDDGKIYESASAAARAYGISTGALSEHCSGVRNRASIGGHKFAYVDEPLPPNRVDSRRKFTDDQVRQLRAAAATNSIYRLAKDNGVSWSVMRDLVEKRSYQHVSP